ncbi:MAG: hypothetical protein EHM36_00720 [Deltaproteobacteria bacterium]|nr:MAG: hypothetical protein EHM36_00720 [Deltaproteobacteria bacterium]
MKHRTLNFDSFGEMGEFIEFCQENNVRVEYQPQIKRVTVVNEPKIPVEQFMDFRSSQMMQDTMEGV